VALAGGPPFDLAAVADATRTLMLPRGAALVEGAGGLLVPLDPEHTIADLARELGLPVLLVAMDGLGVLSHTLTAAVAAQARGVALDAVVLVAPPPDQTDASVATNLQVLRAHLDVPVHPFPRAETDAELTRAGARLLERLVPSASLAGA